MRTIKIKSFGLLLMLLATAAFTGCDKFSLQENYKYDSSPLNRYIDMTAWEYMNSRPDIFSLMIEAVEYAGMTDVYEQREVVLTYLLIDDIGMRQFLNRQGFLLIPQVNVEKIKKLLQYHIISGEYHAYDKKLPVEPIYVKNLLAGQDGLMTIKINKSSANSVGAPIANGNIVVNENASNFASARISSISSNIMPLNGVIHVFSGFAYYRKDANYITAY